MSEVARELAAKFLGDWIGSYDPDESRWIMCKGALSALLAQHALEARNEALEEAAQACESLYEKPIHCEEVGMCVAAIRSLAAAGRPAEKEPK